MADLTCRTITSGVRVGPEGMMMGCFMPETSSFTCVPPTSMTRIGRLVFISSFANLMDKVSHYCDVDQKHRNLNRSWMAVDLVNFNRNC